MIAKSILYYGSEEPLPECVDLRAGPLTMIFEPQRAALRSIRLGDREVLRGINAPVRDHNWGTVWIRVSNIALEQTEGAFRLSFDVTCREGSVDFFWQGTITGDERGTVRFAMDGTARSTFLRNRIGFCILHPMRECAGRPCTVGKVDGSEEKGVFPDAISPHQPFMDMKGISHEVVPGLMAEVRFEGEIFEMEDQRNWTDASYKTYCTPLSRPFPVEVKEGATVTQSVTLSLKGELPAEISAGRGSQSQIAFEVGRDASGRVPFIGLGTAGHGVPLDGRETNRIRALNLSHLRVDLNLADSSFNEGLARAAAEAEVVGTALEVALHLSDKAEGELQVLLAELEKVGPSVTRWLIFHSHEMSTSEKWVRLARRYLPDYDPKAQFGSGTNAYFTELNRERPPVKALDLVCYSINPQVHAFDNTSLVETLEAQAATVASTRRFTGDLPISITPVTLKPRFNPNATGPQPEPGPGELPSQVDVRQMSLFGAAWTVGSVKYLAESGVHSATYYETSGWLGVMERGAGSPVSERFPSIPGSVFPLYHVLADVGEFRDADIIPSVSSASLSVDGVALGREGRARILLANLSPIVQPVRLVYPGLSEYVRVKHLNEENVEIAMRDPESFRTDPGLLQPTKGDRLALSLLPYSVVRVDTIAGDPF